jgi:hypothetical protein
VVIKYLTQYLTGWGYRQPVTVSNTSGAVLTNYQIKLTVNYVASKMKSDFSDLRFTRLDGVTLLPYYIESYTASTSAVIWVKVDSIPTTGTQIFMYYGNASAVTASSADNTFDFFDDFTGTAVNTSKWNMVNSTGFSVSGGQLYGTNTTGRITSIATFNPGVILEIKEYRTGTLAANGHGIGGFWSSDSDGIGWLDHPGNFYYRNDSTWVAQGAQAPADIWRKSSIAVPNSTQVILNSVNWSTGATIWSPGILSNVVSAEPISLGPRPGESASYLNQAYSAYWDWVLVRKYASTDPTSSFGTEEGGGACGSSNGQSFVLAPTTNLCNYGTASAVSGTGTWTWTCTGTVGSPASCSANNSAYVSAVSTSTNLACFVTNGACSGTTIFNLYDYLGNHAELSTQTNYAYKVCCTGTNISNSCSGTYHDTVLKLSGVTNAHAEENTLSNYANNVCLSSSTLAVSCTYGTSCSSDFTCLASISSDTNAHIGQCSAYATKVCCRIGIPVDACTSRIVSNKFISAKDTDIQLCSGADITNTSDPCYNVCWKGTGTPVVTSSNWKCAICHDANNLPVSCSTLSSTTFTWTMPTGYVSPTNYTLTSGTLTSANPIVKFVTQDSTRQLTLGINTYGVNCSSQSSKQNNPTWKEISPFK